MIHKHVLNPDKSTGKSVRIRALVEYVSNPDDGAKCIFFGLSPTFICTDLPGIIAEMTANAQGATRSRDTIHHTVLSWPEAERPTPEQVAEAVKIYIDHIGFEEHLYVYGLHDDTNNNHLHIVLDRATAEGAVRKINRGFTQLAGAEAIALIEAAQGWMPEENAMVSLLEDGTLVRSQSQREASDLAPAPPQRVADQAAHAGGKSQIEILQGRVADLFRTFASWSELHSALAVYDLQYEPRGQGAIIRGANGDAFKASSISRHASFKKLEARLGTFACFDLSQPEVPGQVDSDADELTAEFGRKKIHELFDRYHASVGAERYLVTCSRADPVTGKELVTILDRAAGETIGLSPDELREKIPLIFRLNSDGASVFLRPLSSHCHHLVVDNMSVESLNKMKEDGVTPAVILASGSGKFHAVVNVPRVAADDTDLKSGNQLAQEINKKFGDSRVKSSSHPHPLIRSSRQEQGKDGAKESSILRLVDAAGGICHAMGKRLRTIYNGLKTGIGVSFSGRKKNVQVSELPSSFPAPELTPFDISLALYEAHRRDVVIQVRKVEDFKKLDATIAERLIATGLSQVEVAATIEAGVTGSGHRAENHDDAAAYAAQTAAHAFQSDMIAQCEEKFGHLFSRWQIITDSVLGSKGFAPEKEQDVGPSLR